MCEYHDLQAWAQEDYEGYWGHFASLRKLIGLNRLPKSSMRATCLSSNGSRGVVNSTSRPPARPAAFPATGQENFNNSVRLSCHKAGISLRSPSSIFIMNNIIIGSPMGRRRQGQMIDFLTESADAGGTRPGRQQRRPYCNCQWKEIYSPPGSSGILQSKVSISIYLNLISH